MKFLFPEFLFALSAIAIPILIHLFNFRRFKRVQFTNVRFLQEVKQETKSRSRLKHLLVLLTRILAICFLVFAFAQPYLPLDEQSQTSGDQAISVYLDNSFSMNAVNNEDRSLFEVGLQYAFEIGNAYPATSVYQLLTNDFEGRHQRMVSQSEFLQLAEEVEVGPAVRPLSEVIARQTDLLDDQGGAQKTIFVVSDFQRSITDIENLENDTNVAVRLIPLTPQSTGNLYIDSCWFDSPIRQANEADRLQIRVVNDSEKAYENVPVKLLVNGVQKALTSIDIPELSSVDTVLSFTITEPGIQNVEVVITDYPVTFDDHFYLSFNIAANTSVLHIQSDTVRDPVGGVFLTNDHFRYETVEQTQVNYATLNQFDLIILSGLPQVSSGLAQGIKQFVENGGSFLLFPDSTINLESYNALLGTLGTDTYNPMDTGNTEVATINMQHPVYREVFEELDDRNLDLPKVLNRFPLSGRIETNRENLLTLRTGEPFLAQYNHGLGKVYLSSVPINETFSNLIRHALFLPTLYEIAFHSQESGTLYYTIGREASFRLNRFTGSAEKPFHLVSPENSIDIIPVSRVINSRPAIFLGQTAGGPSAIQEAGNYQLSHEDQALRGVAFNYERRESDLRTLTAEELTEKLAERGLDRYLVVENDYSTISKTISDISQGQHFWDWCILITLFFLGVEVALLRLWKT